MTAFSRFEAAAQRLVEDSFRHILGKGLQPQDVARLLAEEIRGAMANDTAVSHYRVCLSEIDLSKFQANQPNFKQEIILFGQRLIQQTKLPMPRFQISGSLEVPPGSVKIIKDQNTAPTLIQPPAPDKNDQIIQPLLARQAFLVVNGREHHLLTKPTCTIGRQQSNDIVLSAGVISRRHAQIRWRHGRFVLFNVSSRGKVKVNGIPKQEHILHSGDLIQISQESLLYAEEGDIEDEADEPTQPYSPIKHR